MVILVLLLMLVALFWPWTRQRQSTTGKGTPVSDKTSP